MHTPFISCKDILISALLTGEKRAAATTQPLSGLRSSIHPLNEQPSGSRSVPSSIGARRPMHATYHALAAQKPSPVDTISRKTPTCTPPMRSTKKRDKPVDSSLHSPSHAKVSSLDEVHGLYRTKSTSTHGESCVLQPQPSSTLRGGGHEGKG